MNYLIIQFTETFDRWDAERLMKGCFLNAYLSRDDKGEILVAPAYSDPLKMGQDASGYLGGKVLRSYGQLADGTKYSLLRPNAWSKS